MGRRSSRSHAGKVLVDEVVSVQGTLLSPACTTPMEEKLEAVKSPLSEAIGRINLLDNRGQFLRPQPSHPPGASGRSVTLTLLGRNVETRCTHYTHSGAALSGGQGCPAVTLPPALCTDTVCTRCLVSLTLRMRRVQYSVAHPGLRGGPTRWLWPLH